MSSIFSQILKGELPGTIVYRNEHCAVIMDAYPTLPGHALVISVRDTPYLQALSETEQSELMRVAIAVANAQASAGFSHGDSHFLINNGKQAGQTVPHVHCHVVPRRRGDGFPFPSLVGNLVRKLLKMKTSQTTLEAQGLCLKQHLELY